MVQPWCYCTSYRMCQVSEGMEDDKALLEGEEEELLAEEEELLAEEEELLGESG